MNEDTLQEIEQGHSSIQTTVDCYSHLVTDDLRAVVSLLEV